jgi:hypothetical protein
VETKLILWNPDFLGQKLFCYKNVTPQFSSFFVRKRWQLGFFLALTSRKLAGQLLNKKKENPRCLALFMPTKRWHKMKNSGNMDAQTQDGSGEIQKIPTT